MFKYGNAAEVVVGKLHREGSSLANEWNGRRGSTLAGHLRHSIVAKELRESSVYRKEAIATRVPVIDEGNAEDLDNNSDILD